MDSLELMEIKNARDHIVNSTVLCEDYWKYREAIGIAVNVLEEKLKYRWHDLRDNPNDLPVGGGQVLVAYDSDDFDVGEYWDEPGEEGWGETPATVIKWRYINPN